jgi:hypothetical protein
MIVAELSNALQEFIGTPRIHAITLTDEQFKKYLEYASTENYILLKELLKTIRDDDKSAGSVGELIRMHRRKVTTEMTQASSLVLPTL